LIIKSRHIARKWNINQPSDVINPDPLIIIKWHN